MCVRKNFRAKKKTGTKIMAFSYEMYNNIVFVQETFQETNSKLEWDLPTDAPHPNLERSDIAHLCGQRNLAEHGDGSQRYATAEILAGPNLLAVSITD
jgi:hypothetical protein